MSDQDTSTAVADEPAAEDLQTAHIEGVELVVRSMEKREIGALIAPWGDVVDTPIGLEVFEPGSFAHVDPKRVVLRLEHQDPPAGRGLTIEERADGAYMTFRVSKTARGDEILTLAADGVTPHVSVGYDPRRSERELTVRGGKRVTALRKVDLREVSTTWKPYYERAAVTYVRSKEETQEVPVAETTEAPATGAEQQAAPAAIVTPQVDLGPVTQAIETQFRGFTEKVEDRLHKLEERARAEFSIPGTPEEQAKQEEANMGRWMHAVLRLRTGERLPDFEMRALADIITTDNVGVVPPTYSSELIGVINARRPFMETTRRLPTPSTGTQLIMPVIETRPTVAEQANEKDELDSTATEINTESFDMVTKGGAGDLSLQILKRSSPEFLSLYLELLGEAYAIESENEAVAELIAAVGGSPGSLDPESLSLGTAWASTFAAFGRAPDTIWLSSAAVGAFIDAKANGTNAPLYSQLAANFTAAGGVGGTISGLRAVHVPALNTSGVDVIVGPSSGFAWAEDGTYTLQVDVPAKAGRDVALVGMLWFAPLYPAAFSVYELAGS